MCVNATCVARLSSRAINTRPSECQRVEKASSKRRRAESQKKSLNHVIITRLRRKLIQRFFSGMDRRNKSRFDDCFIKSPSPTQRPR